VSRTSNNDADIKAGKNLKKKNKKRDHIEKNVFLGFLADIKKDIGIPDVTPGEFWSIQRNVSKFFNHRTVLHCTFFSYYF
jgi:hypothetical protein